MTKPYRLVNFPGLVYPVLYKAFYIFGDGGQDPQYEFANILTSPNYSNALNAITEVYSSYYHLTFNINYIYNLPVAFNPSPYTVTFVIVYLVNGIEYYVWEFLPIWNNLLKLHKKQPLISLTYPQDA